MEKIVRLNEEKNKLWNDFVNKNKDSRFYHSLKFKETIEETYKNCKSEYYLLINNNVKAIFPFFIIKSKLIGNRLISLPFVDNGGFLGEYKKEDIKKLIKELKKINDLKYIEIRLNSFMKNFENDKKILLKLGFNEEKSKQQFILTLTSEGDVWKRFHKHTRNDIRKAQKSGLKLKKLSSGKELKRFHKLYVKNMKFFGTPQHSYRFFKNFFDIMNENIFGFNCYFKEKIIGSIIIFYEGKRGYISHNISDVKYREYRPNDILYWELIKWAMKKKIKYIDMGQIDKESLDSKAIGLYKFKKKWLGKAYDRNYFYYYFDKEENVNKKNKKKDKLKKFRVIWKKLPLSIIKIIGPKIASQLGI